MNKTERFRYQKTIGFLSKHITKQNKIIDLGVESNMSKYLSSKGFQLENSYGYDFDLEAEKIKEYEGDVLIAFEVLEHLVSPLSLLQNIKPNKLIVSVPLKLWFAKAYRNVNDKYDQHYHEFESWQLDMLLEKAGWKIIDSEKWTPPLRINGFRSILRGFTPRYYVVYAERI